MGFFDIFKKKEKNNNIHQSDNRQIKNTFDASFSATNDGRLKVDFYDREAEFKQFYDITRLIVDGTPLNIDGQEVYNCMVSWYGENDCQTPDKENGGFSSMRSRDYRGVLAQIDLNLLQSDPNYCTAVMKGLLNKSRVEKYLENGMQECPEMPCGKYIGGIRQTQTGYNKFFDVGIGKASHNSRLMVDRRQKRREHLKAAKQKEIESRKAQIAKLQSEIDEMSLE